MNALVAQAPPVRPVLFNRYQKNPLANNQQYINWRESTDSNVLIIHGQSPRPWLSGFVFEDIVKNSSDDGIRSYFSFDGGDDRYKDTWAFLSTMAAQWVRTEEVLKSDFDLGINMSRFLAQRTLTEYDLLLLLSRIRYFYSQGEMVFVLDNLDECLDKLSSFWRLAAEMSESWEKPWKFLIMTKSIDSLDEWLKGSPTIVLEDEFSLEDVDPCVRDEIDYALHQLDARYASTLSIGRYRDGLLRKCGNDVGLTRLLVQDVQNSPSLDALTNALERLPEVNLEVLFRKTMRAVPEAKRSLVARAITWLVFAFRPLSIGELRSVLGISESTQDADGMGAMNTLTGIPIFDFSNPQEMRFQHAELKNLILQCDKEEWYHVQATAHEIMAEACLAFLGTTGAHDALNTVCEVRHGVLSTPCVRPRVDVATYAVCYWDRHYRLASNRSRLITQVVEFFKSKAVFRGWQMAHWFMSNPFSRVDRTYVCPLPLVASMGLDDVYERWIQDNRMSEAEQKLWLPYAVAEAARNRHGSLVLHLLRSVELDRATAEYVLEAACSGGDEDVLVDVVSRIRKTAVPPFIWPAFVVRRAAWNGHAKVVQALMDEGADISGSEGAPFGQCSLYIAARNGHVEVVKLVAMHDESLVMARDEYDNSVLDAAARWGNANIVSLLLEKGAPPDADDGGAVSSACSVGAHAAVRVFLEHGAQTETKGDGESWPPLHTAIQEGAWQCVQELLRFKSDANHECPGGTPLMFAVKAKRLDMVQLLVEHGADVNKRHDEQKATALQMAVSQEGGRAMVEWLVNKGADVNLRTPGSSPLFGACLEGDVDMVRLLLDKGAKVNDVCSLWTPLHGAYKSAAVTRLLLEAGASVDEVVAGSERSPLFLAAEWGQTDVVAVLVEHHADVNLPYRPADDDDMLSGFTPLLAALNAGHGDTARVLLEAGADTSIKPASGIHPVLYMDTTDLLRMVLEFQPDLGLTDRDGDTALNAALERDTVRLADMKLLVHAGSNVDTTNTAGWTPLHKAIDKDKLDIARFLLKRGANANANDNVLNTGAPLHLACSKASPAAVRLLVDAGANVNLIASYHGSPAQAACGRSLAVGVDEEDDDDVERTILEVLQCLVSDTATMDVNATGGLYGSALAAGSYRATAPVLQFLLRLGATTDTCDQAGRYPIHLAAVRPTTANFAVLRDANANLYARDNAGRTLVHFAIVSGNLHLLRCVLQATNGLLHAPDADGWTPLHYAARGTYYRHSDLVDQDMREQRKHEFVVFLIDQGADICALTVGPDGKQSSPLKLANYHGAKQETLHLLTPNNNVNNDTMAWDQISHQSKKAFDAWPYIYCDGCLYVSPMLFLCVSNKDTYA
jgi:ankyrin repeat protein